MSDPRDNEDSEQEMPELSDDEDDLLDEETEDEDFPLINNPSGVETNFGTSSGFTDAPQGEGTSKPIAELQAIEEVPRMMDRMESDSDTEDDDDELDAEAGKKTEPDVVELENGGRENGIRLLPEDLKVDAPIEPEEGPNQSRPSSLNFLEGEDDSGAEDDQSAFMKELERFHKERCLDFKPPKFYGEGLNCLKLWRAVARLGGYERVTSCKLWRQVGESFRPPKTCTTVSWTFRIFYEKALLEYERHKIRTGELQVPVSSLSETIATDKKMGGNQSSGSGRARRDAAARAMQGWHSQRLLGNGEVGDPIIKDKNSISLFKRDKHLKSIGLKRKKASSLERSAKVPRTKLVKSQGDSMVVDIGEPADWVKINVRRTKDCYEVYALVPGLLREEVHVQSDPCGRLIISGEPEQLDNPWGVTPFKKVITLPSRIDPHQTSAVVTLHGQLFVRAPFEQSDL